MPLPNYVTVTEIAEAARCGERTVREAVQRGELAGHRVAGRIVVREELALAWIERDPAEDEPHEELEATA